MYLNQFYRNLERFERQRDDMLLRLLEFRCISVADRIQDIRCWSAEETAPVPTYTVVQKARNLFIPKDEKILRKSGLKDANGNWTNDSIRVFVEMLLEDKDNKKKLLELAKELTRKKKDEDED